MLGIQSVGQYSNTSSLCLPKGKIKPKVNKDICAVLLLKALPWAPSSTLGALKTLRRPPRDVLSCQRCGDQVGEILRPGGALTSAMFNPCGLLEMKAIELLCRLASTSGGWFRVRKMLREMLSVEVEGRRSELLLFGSEPLFRTDDEDTGRA